MIRRLVEANFFQNPAKSKPAQISFWLTELRTPQLLVGVAQENPQLARKTFIKRPLLRFALAGDLDKLESALATEEARERKKDRIYWQPLRKELEQLRRRS